MTIICTFKEGAYIKHRWYISLQISSLHKWTIVFISQWNFIALSSFPWLYFPDRKPCPIGSRNMTKLQKIHFIGSLRIWLFLVTGRFWLFLMISFWSVIKTASWFAEIIYNSRRAKRRFTQTRKRRWNVFINWQNIQNTVIF